MAAYRTFAGPFAKVFLGAVFTYQVIYQTWMKLEMDESKLEKNGMFYSNRVFSRRENANSAAEEVAVLEKKAREMAGVKK